MRKRLAIIISVLLLVSSCSNNSEKSSPTVPPDKKTSASPVSKIDNLKSCQMWQQATIEFLEIDAFSATVFWATGIKIKNAATTADAKLKDSLLVIAEKDLSTEEKDLYSEFTSTPAEDAARDYVISTCESLGVFVK
jgi:hypothetical protein